MPLAVVSWLLTYMNFGKTAKVGPQMDLALQSTGTFLLDPSFHFFFSFLFFPEVCGGRGGFQEWTSRRKAIALVMVIDRLRHQSQVSPKWEVFFNNLQQRLSSEVLNVLSIVSQEELTGGDQGEKIGGGGIFHRKFSGRYRNESKTGNNVECDARTWQEMTVVSFKWEEG